jgi:predicted SAM-dependent methyltransferase
LRNFARTLRGILQPLKIARTILYHARAFQLSGRRHAGVHLGSGGLRIAGFLNIDADFAIDCDVVARSERLKLAAGSVACIYASHLFEHIERQRVSDVLRNWHAVLKPGGKLYLCVPDLETLARLYLETLPRCDTEEGRQKIDLIARVIYGGQTDAFDFHYFGYSLATIRVWLEAAGFTDIRRFDRVDLKVAPFRDGGYACIGDTLISLNVEATRPATA